MNKSIKNLVAAMQRTAVATLCIVFLLLTVNLFSCTNNEDEKKEQEELKTERYYVWAPSPHVDIYESDWPLICGWPLFLDTGNPGHRHGNFVYAENLPKEYQIYLLPVIVTYRIVKDHGKDCPIYPVIHIVKIERQ